MMLQTACPLVEGLWEKRADADAFKRKRAKQTESGFHIISREPTKDELKEYPFGIIMTHSVHGDVVVPDIALLPLCRLSYLDLTRKILVANPTKDLDMFILCELWEAILTKIYDYEYDWRATKKFEVKSLTSPLTK